MKVKYICGAGKVKDDLLGSLKDGLTKDGFMYYFLCILYSEKIRQLFVILQEL